MYFCQSEKRGIIFIDLQKKVPTLFASQGLFKKSDAYTCI